MKKLFLIGLLLFFSIFASAAISDLSVPSSVPLNEILTVDGVTSPAQADVQCSFRIYEVDSNALVKRLSDEITTSGGVFSSTYYVVQEPPIFRGYDYNVVVNCASDQASATFTAGQRRNLVHAAEQEFNFAFDKGNWEVFYIYGSIISFLFIIGFLLLYWWKQTRS